ncbi:MAG: preprotein translocase subunit YajC [Actinomycetales bacterium]|nr:preprotein translocase subunit YajC [Actinomycetales bacterium]
MDQLFLPLLVVVMVGSMFWLSSRNRKQQQAAAAFRDNLQPGQDVVTIGGAFGTVVSVDGDVVALETAPGVVTRWTKAAIARLVETPVADEDADDLEPDEDPEWDEQDWDEEDWDETGEDAEELDEDSEDSEDASGPEDDRRG